MTDSHQRGGQADHGLATPDCSPSISYSHEAVCQLQVECGTQVEAFIAKRLRDDLDTARVLERCWADLVRSWHVKGELTEPRALLFRLAYLRTIDRLRQIARRPEDGQYDLDRLNDTATALMHTPDLISQTVVRVDVRRALATLPDRQQRALLYVYGDDLEYQDAAALLACSVDTVNNLLRAAKRNLKKSPLLVGYHMPASASPSSPPEVHT